MTTRTTFYSANLLIRLVDILIIVVEVALGLRLILKLLGANPASDFVSWVYATTAPLLEPFSGMFPSPVLQEGFILEFSTLFALVAYAILGWLLVELIKLIVKLAETP